MRWILVHHHFRPGGVRRVIEQATPFLVAGRATSVLLISGEAPELAWFHPFARRLSPIPVSWEVEPALGYAAETRMAGSMIARRVRSFLRRVLAAGTDEDWVWVHNAGLGRNIILMRELARICRRSRVKVAWHHHDWWFENRWNRWAEMRRLPKLSLRSVARASFPSGPGWLQIGINRRDVARLRRGFPRQTVWLPNPVAFPAADPTTSIEGRERAREWLAGHLDGDRVSPVWVVPCRFLRRKNMAEAVLVTRWLRPDAWLVTTAGASSEDERPTWERFVAAARKEHWRVRVSVLDRAGEGAPSVEDLLAASEVVVLTSIQEGFGLPYLEAAAAGRPLVGRRLPNVVPDLESLGLRFPTLYGELMVSRDWLDWQAEVTRQKQSFAIWRSGLPRGCRQRVRLPTWLETTAVEGVPFSRLTFTGQLEILAASTLGMAHVADRLNPWLVPWRQAAGTAELPRISWDAGAIEKLSGDAYARRFWNAAHRAAASKPASVDAAERVQAEFLRERLGPDHLYPLLWARET